MMIATAIGLILVLAILELVGVLVLNIFIFIFSGFKTESLIKPFEESLIGFWFSLFILIPFSSLISCIQEFLNGVPISMIDEYLICGSVLFLIILAWLLIILFQYLVCLISKKVRFLLVICIIFLLLGHLSL